MSETQTHYEVHGLQSGFWAVQRVCDDKVTGIDVAKNLYRELKLDAVKVVRVTFDSSDPTFQDKEIYFDGERPKAFKHAAIESIEPICQNSGDMYVPGARRAIYKLLQKPLEGWKITPLELLYHQGHVQKLNDTGQILQGAVQRAAISQVQKTGQKVTERVLDLYAITNEILQDLKTTTIEETIPEIHNDDLLQVVEKAKETEDWRKVFMMALARHFQDFKSTDEKFEKILDYLHKYDDPEIVGMLDRYLGDFLVSPTIIQTIMGEEDNLGEALLSLIDFIRGSKKISPGMHKEAARLNMLLRDQKLPETRQSLTIRLRDTLSGNKSFVKENPLKSMSYHRRLLSRMRISEGEHIGGQDAVESLIARCERMTGSTTVGVFLSGLEHPLDRVERLLDVNKGVIGPVNIRTMANYILPVLDSSANIKFLAEEQQPPIASIARLKKIQVTVKEAGFQKYYGDKLLIALDDVAVEILTSRDVLGKLSRDTPDTIRLGLNLLQLISTDKLTEPKVLQLVRNFAKTIIVSEKFMQALESKSQSGDTSQAEFFKQFYKLLEKTGIK